MSLPMTPNVTRQLPLTFPAHVPLRSPRSSWSSRPGKAMSRALAAAFRRPRIQPESLGMLGLYPSFVASGKEPFKSFVAEVLDRHSGNCNPYRYGLQSGQQRAGAVNRRAAVFERALRRAGRGSARIVDMAVTCQVSKTFPSPPSCVLVLP